MESEGQKAQLVKGVFEKLREQLFEEKAFKHLPGALRIREEGYEFEVIYEPEKGHYDSRPTGREVEVWPGIDATPPSFGPEMEDVWVVDSPERIEIRRLR